MFNLNFLPNYRTVMIMDNIIIEYLCPNRNLFLMLRESSYQLRQTFLEHWTCAIVSFHCCDLMPGMTYRFYGVPPTVTCLLMIFIINMSNMPSLQTYFGQAKTACLCLYCTCCSCHLWFYNRGGRLRRVEIAALMVGARAKEGKGGGEGLLSPCPLPCSLWLTPIPPLLWSLYVALSQAKTFACHAWRKHLQCRLPSLWKLNLKQAHGPQLEVSETSP